MAFPPLYVLADLIRSEAKTRTDSSLNIFSSVPQEKIDRSDKCKQASIAAHKTQVNMSVTRDATDRINPPHPLNTCRGFRVKSLEDHKQLLKELSACIRCCSSIDHMAKQYKAEIHCSKCDRDHHVSALHPDPAPWKKNA